MSTISFKNAKSIIITQRGTIPCTFQSLQICEKAQTSKVYQVCIISNVPHGYILLRSKHMYATVSCHTAVRKSGVLYVELWQILQQNQDVKLPIDILSRHYGWSTKNSSYSRDTMVGQPNSSECTKVNNPRRHEFMPQARHAVLTIMHMRALSWENSRPYGFLNEQYWISATKRLQLTNICLRCSLNM